MNINLIARTNGVGLDQDVQLCSQLLTQWGYKVSKSHARGLSWWQRWIPGKPEYDINIFMERVFPAWTPFAKTNILIPNQERFPKRQLRLLDQVQHIFCKTKHAENIFKRYHHSVFHTGFTSRDRIKSDVSMNYARWFHLAGRSTLKGTETIVDLWQEHPEWPKLTLVQNKQNAPRSVPENIHLITEYLSNEALNELQSSHGIHCCPSLSEGWGHHIVEGMSTGAVVITTDAPPMNELVDPSRGYLVAHGTEEPRHLGTNFYVSKKALEKTIQKVIALDQPSLQEMGQKARNWFTANNTTFAESMAESLHQCIKVG
jgi:glycosyltransferase involved in cell wall biosynthesis